TLPVAATTATINSAAGTYPILVSGAVAANYSFTYVNGTLTITPASNLAPTDVMLSRSDINENNTVGDLIGTISTTDADAGNTFTYTLVTGAGSTDNGTFTIAGNQLRAGAAFDFETKTSYTIRLRTTDNGGLTFEKTFVITVNDVNEVVNQAPTMAAIANQALCYAPGIKTIALTGISAVEAGQNTNITVSSINSSLLATLSVTQASGGNATISYSFANNASGTATITVTVKDDGGTTNGGTDVLVRTFTITANALPVTSITSSKGNSVSLGDLTELTATGGVSYTWATADGIISGHNTASLTVQPKLNTIYSVTVTNATGCNTTQQFAIEVKDDHKAVQSTNIMSPNGDGVNDQWVVKNIELYPNNLVSVFDRAGRKVFEKKGYTNTWDATINGSPLAEGTYYYIIDFGDGKDKKKGFITIVRN
ncbi:MAG: T9SS type B sorting domain-containing protein, partial [Sphingobacteriales bacterium]